jgi:hypothetical protein
MRGAALGQGKWGRGVAHTHYLHVPPYPLLICCLRPACLPRTIPMRRYILSNGAITEIPPLNLPSLTLL